MNALIKYFNNIGQLNTEQVNIVERYLTPRELRENDYFLEAGKYSNEIGFIEKGVFRVFFYDKDGNDIVRYFLCENQFIVDLYSFDNSVICSEYIQAISDSKIIIISRNSYDELAELIPQWNDMIGRIKQNALIEKLQNRSDLVNKDATTKYLDFIKNNPTLANRIPLGHLASYLGIKQQSLSRIRNKIATKNAI